MGRKVVPIASTQAQSRTATVHGRSVGYVEAGNGDLLLLIHGMAGTAENWGSVIEPLALGHTVIAPDFPGHGTSAPGGGDYSLGSLASGLRDLMLTLGHERATLVGHSLGGGVAMQFTYQFPEMVERLVLVSSGGLGPRRQPDPARGRAARRRPLHLRHGRGRRNGRLGRSGAASARSGCGPTPTSPRSRAATPRSPTASGARPSWRPFAPWSAPTASASPASDKLYLADALPLLIVWGDRDPIIPVEHGEDAHATAAQQPPRDLRGRRPRAPARVARPLRRRPAALPRRDRARPLRPRRVAGAVQDRLSSPSPS